MMVIPSSASPSAADGEGTSEKVIQKQSSSLSISIFLNQ